VDLLERPAAFGRIAHQVADRERPRRRRDGREQQRPGLGRRLIQGRRHRDEKRVPILPKFVQKVHFIKNLNSYKTMFLSSIKKEKSFCILYAFDSVKHVDFWKTDIVGIMDGGNCCFQAKINLDSEKVIEFRMNGVASW
jgi:hypothetical protein